MSFSLRLKEEIAEFHLLQHPFYQDWMAGKIEPETLKEYAKQYYLHVKAFPTYISATHANCDDIAKRRVLLENLADEEGLNGVDHPELWLRFAEGVGTSREEAKNHSGSTAINNVIDTFKSQAHSSYVEGLASLYAYEYQVPEIAESKIAGLKEHYGVRDERSLSFFEAHKEADVYHREACEKLMDVFSKGEQTIALAAAKKSAKALWGFLSDLQENRNAA